MKTYYKENSLLYVSLNHFQKTYRINNFYNFYPNNFIAELGYNRIVPMRSFKLGRLVTKITGYKFAQD